MNYTVNISIEDLTEPLTLSTEIYLSKEYAQAEGTKLWARVWQHVGRVEELPEVGNFFSYEIGEDSFLIVRAAPDVIKAYHNVCSHRGRQLVDIASDEHDARGKRKLFVCGYHGWRYDLDGKCTRVLDQADWKCALTEERTRLSEVKVDTWGGWIWINMDRDCEPLRSYLEPAAGALDPFQLQEMRYRWRQWLIFDCNWKVAIEAFMEPYHVEGTHPQLMKYGDYYAWSRAQGLHGNDGFDPRNAQQESMATATVSRTAKGGDPRVMTATLQQELWDTIGASTTRTLVDAARRLVHELPEGTPADEVHHHWFESARRDDAARGVEWPAIAPEQVARAGLAWHVFPNLSILHGLTFALCYRARPYGTNPDQCIFEAFALERFPRGQEPKTEWVYAEPTDVEKWRLVLTQDFSNMRAVQKGMKSRGFRGPLPNPHQERKITNFHRNLARYMGSGAPRRIG
ncbi:MAG TPA: aromatic ring-hydroxylating dioxygenase subunit alpha [Polyangiales bacterium]|nr:aromatic ring-hydroxylating dioxygenase subunit alpha [Polyangiales bacterium]